MNRQVIQDFINVTHDCHCRPVAEEIADVLRYEHRTNQQSFWRTIQHLIHLYSTVDHDMRNEAAVQWCKKVDEHTERDVLPHF